jgi:tyrosine-protein kinase Etk/Wzc
MEQSASTERDAILKLLRQRWRTIAACAAVGLAVGLAYALTAAKWYEARLSVVPAERSQDMNVLSKLPSMGGLASQFQSDVQRIRAVLTSQSVADEVIAKFDLKKRYGEAHIEHARIALWSHCRTSVDKKSGIVELICEDQDPKFAMELTASFGDIGNKVFGRVSASSAREERRFLETQVVQARRDVEEASQKLREFQEQYKLIDLPEQSKAVISAMASLKGDLLSKQLELSYLSHFSSRTEAGVMQLKEQIAILDSKLKQLEDSKEPNAQGSGSTAGQGSGSADFFPNAMRVPELRYQLEQLFREQKIKETLFFLMTQRYETAKVDEARDTSTFQILDYPTLPTYKSRPKRLRILILGLLGGLFAGSAWVVLRGWSRRRGTPTPA